MSRRSQIKAKLTRTVDPVQPPTATPEAIARPTTCPACGSTNRAPYAGHKQELDYAGEFEGRPYNKVVWRRTRCLDCGQARLDKSHELVAESRGETAQPD